MQLGLLRDALRLVVSNFLLGLLLDVRLDVEVDEKSQTQSALGERQVNHTLGVATVVNEGDEDVDHEEDELSDLGLRDVLLPPEVGLHLRSKCGQEVITVHDDMDSGVHDQTQQCLAIGSVGEPKPAGPSNQGVMGVMKGGDVREFLVQKEEERVEEITDANPEVPIAKGQNFHGILVGGVSHTCEVKGDQSFQHMIRFSRSSDNGTSK